MVIASGSNEKIKTLKKLLKDAGERKKRGLYVVEGLRIAREIPQALLCEIYVSESALAKYGDIIKKITAESYTLTDSVYKSVTDTKTPQGILAVVRMQEYTMEDICKGGDDKPFILILEKLQDPGNLGTIIRSAEASGVTGIILSRDCVDRYNPKVVRSTMGSLFRMPIYVSEHLETDIDILKSKNITVYGAHLKGKDMYEFDFCMPSAFLIGNEANGLSENIAATSDKLLFIPMKGNVNSLNAAVSASVICYEVLRQRLL